MPKNLKMLSQMMRIGEGDLTDEELGGKRDNINVPHTMKTKQNMENKARDPLDFEHLYLIGFNENFHADDSRQDQNFYEALRLTPAQRRKTRPPQMIACNSGASAGKLGKGGLKAQKEMQKHIENIVRYYCMPQGVKYQKYTDVTQTLLQVRQNLKYQLLLLEQLEEERIQMMSVHQFSCPAITEGDEYSTYLVNMIKSVEDPTEERYLLITILQDFHLVKLSPKHRQKYGVTYGVATTDVAIAMQFSEKRFLNLDVALCNIK
jgi:hypothetical protein